MLLRHNLLVHHCIYGTVPFQSLTRSHTRIRSRSRTREKPLLNPIDTTWHSIVSCLHVSVCTTWQRLCQCIYVGFVIQWIINTILRKAIRDGKYTSPRHMPVLGNFHPIKIEQIWYFFCDVISLLARVFIFVMYRATQEVPMQNIWNIVNITILFSMGHTFDASNIEIWA